MSNIKGISPRSYANVMEVLVAEEVERQLSQLPSRVLKYVKAVEVETYALNRLPCLYASSEKGWHCQRDKAERTLHAKIADAVRQAIAAVQVDPLRTTEPLPLAYGEEVAALLERFRKVLGKPTLTWESLLQRLQQRVTLDKGIAKSRDVSTGISTKISTDGRLEPAASAPTSTVPATEPAPHPSVWRPGTYGETSWKPKHERQKNQSSTQSTSAADSWNDPGYRL